jgi:hypothetical protein
MLERRLANGLIFSFEYGKVLPGDPSPRARRDLFHFHDFVLIEPASPIAGPQMNFDFVNVLQRPWLVHVALRQGGTQRVQHVQALTQRRARAFSQAPAFLRSPASACYRDWLLYWVRFYITIIAL